MYSNTRALKKERRDHMCLQRRSLRLCSSASTKASQRARYPLRSQEHLEQLLKALKSQHLAVGSGDVGNGKDERSLDSDMEIDVAATDPKLPSKPFPFFALPAELRNEIYAHHAATENTVTVAMRRSRVSEDWHAGYKPLLPKPPALLQVCQQARTEYFPIWVSQTEFTLGLASDSSIEVVKMWLEWIRPFAGYLNQMSFILRGEKWTEGRSDLPPHGWIEMVYDGWVEYWFDFRKGVADGDLIYVDGERLEYSAPADRSEMIGKEREAFGVTVEEMRKKRQAGKLVVGDVKKLINALVRDHGHLVETRVLRRRFGPW